MKYSIITLSTITLIAAFVLSGCESPSNKMEKAETSVIEAERDLEIAKSEVKAELQIYRAKHQERVKEFNQTISEIKEEIEEESDKDVREKLEKELDEYETSLNNLKEEMGDYKASGKDNWNDFKESFSSRMDDLGDSLENFFSPITTTSSIN